jgi:hypothetical protein
LGGRHRVMQGNVLSRCDRDLRAVMHAYLLAVYVHGLTESSPKVNGTVVSLTESPRMNFAVGYTAKEAKTI